MNKAETVKMFTVISAMFPRDTRFAQADQLMIDMWQRMLADIPYDAAEKAITASVATSPYPPSIAEIRDYATRLTGERRMTAEEAWGLASEAIRTYGTRVVRISDAPQEPERPARFGEPVRVRPSGLEYEAKRHLPPEVWGVLKRMGYQDVCESDEPDVIRGQFMAAWRGHDKEAKEARVIGGVVPEMLVAIIGSGNGIGLIGGGKEDGEA